MTFETPCIDITEKRGQDQSLWDAVSQKSKPASLAITGGENEAYILDKFQNHLDYVLIREKSQQLAGEAVVADSVKSFCQVDKHGTVLFLSLKKVLNILREQNGLVNGRPHVSKFILLPRELWIDNCSTSAWKSLSRIL